MAEILTESFCERCGTRYTFEASAPRKGRVGKIRTLSRGLKNYVLSDESTLEEALDEARGEEERMLSTQQLEAFHQTFNFCMSCRQYTCANCWNELEARCLSCAPDLTHDVLPTAFPDLPIVPTFAASSMSPAPELMALPDPSWPSSDLPTELAEAGEDATPRVAAAADAAQVVAEPPAESPAADEPIEEELDERLVARLAALGAIRVVPTIRPDVPKPEPEAPTPEPEPALAPAAEPETPEPQRSVEEDEAEIAAMIAAAETLPVDAEPTEVRIEEPTVEPLVAQAPEPIQLAFPELSPEPGPVETEVAASQPAAATLADRVGWTMVAPEAPLVMEDRVAAAQPAGNGHDPTPTPPPVWPTPTEAPQWPTPQARPAPVAAGTSVRHGTAALWVASSRDVVSHPGSGVSACVSCGLPLSANARFCRRCGSRQSN